MPEFYVDGADDRREPSAEAVPGRFAPAEIAREPRAFTLQVDGEEFAVRANTWGGTGYDWVSGPNPEYGFGSSGPVYRRLDDHRDEIRVFLSMIDPATGYIGDG